MPTARQRLFILLLLVSAAAVGFRGKRVEVIAITNVTAIDPCRGVAVARRTIVIEAGRIRAVEAAAAAVPAGAQVIDGTAKFVIPGLWDSHVHLTKAGVSSLPLFVANGVTAVRDVGSDLRELQGWRDRIDAGTLVGPRIRTSGPMLESKGNVERMLREGTVEPVARLRIGIGDAADAREVVDRLAAQRADLIKIRSITDVATLRAVAGAAKRHHLPLATHPVVSPDELLQAGVRSVEHFVAYPPLDGRTSADRRALFVRMAAAGMFLSTTMVNVDGIILMPYEEAARRLADTGGTLDTRRKFVCGYLLEDWREQIQEKKGESLDAFRKDLRGLMRDMKEMYEAHVRFLAGTDLGVAFMYPGFSLHDELEFLVQRIGVRPLDALRAATVNPAAFFAKEKDGCLSAGSVADLVLLNADPLADIRHTRRIVGVMTADRWWDRAALDRLLSGVEADVKHSCGGAATGGATSRQAEAAARTRPSADVRRRPCAD